MAVQTNILNEITSKYSPYLLLTLLSYCVASVTLTFVRPMMIPKQSPKAQKVRSGKQNKQPKAFYTVITRNNVFNEDGKIPPALSADGQDQPDFEGPATKSTLPLKLMGTIVHVDPYKSVASINTRNKTLPFFIEDEIQGQAQIISIERAKVIFRNLRNNKKEYIDIPKDQKINFGIAPPKKTSTEAVVEKRGSNEFAIKKADILKYTSDLGSLLQQARAVPYYPPGANGEPDGYRLVSIQEGSVFETLGLKAMDIIKTVNGEPVRSPTQAMELYNSLKNSPAVAIGIERNGQPQEFNYSVVE